MGSWAELRTGDLSKWVSVALVEGLPIATQQEVSFFVLTETQRPL